jgi:hypothetical protein
MSARKIRRAEAHAARKAARKAGFPVPVSSTPVVPSTPTPSDAELAAILDQPVPTETMFAKQTSTGRPETMFAKQTPTGRPETMFAKQTSTGRPETIFAKQTPTGRPETMFAKQTPTGRPETMFAKQTPTGSPETVLENIETITAPPASEPWRSHLSAARLAANKANAMLSRGPLCAATKAISAQNHTVHGLARHHDGTFKLLTSESSEAFESLKQALVAEHKPSTETEAILVKRMAESHWLENRAQRLQDTCMDPDTGEVADEKKFSLYMRYKNTHTRAFHKCLADLLKLRAEKRKAELGVEAQRVQTEKHELKKELHGWEIMKKDAAACRELAHLSSEKFAAAQQNSGFHAAYNEQLAKRGLESNDFCGATRAA